MAGDQGQSNSPAFYREPCSLPQQPDYAQNPDTGH
jgi:hypothetical protein